MFVINIKWGTEGHRKSDWTRLSKVLELLYATKNTEAGLHWPWSWCGMRSGELSQWPAFLSILFLCSVCMHSLSEVLQNSVAPPPSLPLPRYSLCSRPWPKQQTLTLTLGQTSRHHYERSNASQVGACLYLEGNIIKRWKILKNVLGSPVKSYSTSSQSLGD